MSDLDEPDEPELVAQLIAYQGGDLDAFQRLFAALAPELARFFAGRLRDPRAGRDASTADDLVQETFLALHRVRRTYRPPLPVRPWVFGIARNVERRNRHRTARRGAHEVRLAVAEPDGDPWLDGTVEALAAEGAVTDPSRMTDLREALRRVPAARRQAWVLHHVHGFSFPEIAARLRIGLDAAKLRSSRAMIALRTFLGVGGDSRG
jgi:RNA polymerase sigma-70 factor (ECF subfamily)